LNATDHIPSEEARYRLLHYLSQHPDASQRELARAMGISLGKVNYCLHALMEKGLIKVRNFTNSRNKAAYAYILTRKGMEEKISVTTAFLRRKIEEFDAVAGEIERLKAEVREMTEAAEEP
jgi:EPS-associated MarR family transcriptional regulator